MLRNLSPINILYKIRKKGIRYFLRRIRQELVSPEYAVTKKILSKINLFRNQSKIASSEDKDILHVFYDLSFEAVTFDFAYFLIDAEIYAKKNGKTKIFLWIIKKDPNLYRPYEKYTLIINEDSQDWRMKNILIPFASMSPIVEGISLIPSDSNFESYSNNGLIYPEGYSKKHRPLMDYKKVFSNLKSNDFEGLMSSRKAIDYIEEWKSQEEINLPIVSITIREYGFDPARNSAIKEWLKFAEWLKEKGYLPVFVPDVDAAWDSSVKFNNNIIFKEVCWNLELRMAFYNACALNFFFSNGLSSLALFNKEIRSISMNPIVEGSQEAKQEIYDHYGLELGQRKYDFAQDFQWLSWKKDSFENIIEEFLEYEKTFLNK